MEVVHTQAGLEVDQSRHASPSDQYNNSQQETHKSGQLTINYAASPSAQIQLDPISQDVPGESRARRNWVFPALLGGLIAALVVGAAIGGGLGAKLAQCSSSNSMCPTPQSSSAASGTSTTIAAATPLPTTSDGLLLDYTPPPASSIYNVRADCDSLEGATQLSQYQESYEVKCDKDLSGGTYTSGSERTYIADIAGLWAYSFQDCIDAYSATTRSSMIGDKCRSVTFGRIIHGSKQANCWLKNGTIGWDQAPTDVNYLSGRLFGS